MRDEDSEQMSRMMRCQGWGEAVTEVLATAGLGRLKTGWEAKVKV